MANYHYVENGQAKGPVAETELDQMIASGGITSETLIWTEGMSEWQSYATVRGGATGGAQPALALAAAAPPVAGGLVCSVCQQTFSPDQVIRYGANYVCGNCKPQFLQRLREGGQIGGQFAYAGFGKRFLAKFVDGLVGSVIGMVVGFVMVLAAGGNKADPMVGILAQLVSMVLGFAYPIFFLGKWGQTLGKMALGIKVVTPEGEPISYGKAAGRVFSEIITSLTLGIGYLMVLWDPERRALHDRIAGTRVIISRRS